MKKRLLLTLLILLLLILTITGCKSQTSVGQEQENKNEEIEELQNKIKRYEENIKDLEEKNKDYQLSLKHSGEIRDEYENFIDRAIEYLDKDSLLKLARSEWVYQIEVDDNPIDNDGNIEVNKASFKIIYSTKMSSLASIHGGIFSKGEISGEDFDHLKIVGIEPSNIDRTDGTVVGAFIYEFEDIPKNTSFKLEISDELRERLGLKSNTINIQVNY